MTDNAPMRWSALDRTESAHGRMRAAAHAAPRWIIRLSLAFILPALLYIALREAPLRDIGTALARLRPWEIAALLCLNALIYCLAACRWWVVVHAENRHIRYLPMIGVRLSVFAVSYFTLGPQVGGEPLQILYLRKSYGLSYTRATASVIMDKLFELLANFVLLCFGLFAAFHSGILGRVHEASLPLLLLGGLVVAWPAVHILMLYHKAYPLSALLRMLGRRVAKKRAIRFLRATEHLAGQFCQRHPRAMMSGLVISLVAAAATVSEYALITSFLHIGLPFWRLVTAWTTGWLSFLAPWPGGLGTLELGQVSVLGSFGVSAAAALSVVLVMRARDLLIGGVGLLLAGNAAGSAQIQNRKARRIHG
ncbi:MAG TPA: lysylphosphatidylglycerol synthase transmembrane domain-containing protein [Anaerolineales bacterium]